MPRITKPVLRVIIKDFANEIRTKRVQTAKPSKTVINFRNDIIDGFERPVCKVPIEILRFRKDNGRIASDVLDHERNVGILDETTDETQARVSKYLEQKDPEKTAILRKSIMHAGQLEPAIITCDGFLINGNRRKMVMDKLHQEHPENDKYSYMKVVILPGEGEPGGPPSIIEIEKIENRYQLQSDGKSEYYGFDRALSIRRKIDIGLSLEEQLRDDPRHAGATQVQINKAVKDCEKEYLEPLKCVNRYLKQFGREGQYHTISMGKSDREGRWQAFKDYSNTYNKHFSNSKNLIELGIEEDEIGDLEEAAFDIIRLRVIPDMPKVHTIMRDLHKYCCTKDGKKNIMKIVEEVEPILPTEECFDDNTNPLPRNEVDAKWVANNKQSIAHHVKRASKSYSALKEQENPIGLLEAALKKLNHKDMNLEAMAYQDCLGARQLAAKIKARADDLESQIYYHEKNLKKMANKKS